MVGWWAGRPWAWGWGELPVKKRHAVAQGEALDEVDGSIPVPSRQPSPPETTGEPLSPRSSCHKFAFQASEEAQVEVDETLKEWNALLPTEGL